MIYEGNKVRDIKIAYIGGGSRGWAWGLMSDIAIEEDISGEIRLFDIDFQAACDNAVIGNKIKDYSDVKNEWKYTACETIKEALTDTDFIIISILPGTFEEMESDVHAPEKYGIYQSVGDSTGPGGVIRALRSIPMYVEIAEAIKKYSPNAWVINYTNPMSVLVKTLYSVFPEIKAFGCCHEVFGTQKVLIEALEDICGITGLNRKDITTNVMGINHFTWIDHAYYKNVDIFPVYKKFVEKYYAHGFDKNSDDSWMNKFFESRGKVKFDLFNRYGLIAAAGDRHLAEFCPGSWYLKDLETIHSWYFCLTPVSWRKDDLVKRLERSRKLVSGEEKFDLKITGEEGVHQIKALLGLADLVTNVNIPNIGQIPNMPLGSIVETNANFTANSVKPIMAGEIPPNVYALMSQTVSNQDCIVEAGLAKDFDLAFQAFIKDPLVNLSLNDSKDLFNQMIKNTKKYL